MYLLNNYSNNERGRKVFHDNPFFRKHISIQVYSPFYNYFFFFFVLVKNQHSFDFYKIVETNLPLAVSFFVFMIFAANSWPVLFWTHRRTTEKAPLKRREIVKFANRTQDLEERTIKLTKCDTINPLTSSIRNCSPNFVYVCMYVWPPRTTGIYWNIVGDWNFVDYTIDCACAI